MVAGFPTGYQTPSHMLRSARGPDASIHLSKTVKDSQASLAQARPVNNPLLCTLLEGPSRPAVITPQSQPTRFTNWSWSFIHENDLDVTKQRRINAFLTAIQRKNDAALSVMGSDARDTLDHARAHVTLGWSSTSPLEPPNVASCVRVLRTFDVHDGPSSSRAEAVMETFDHFAQLLGIQGDISALR
ncbi:hypothetical protein K402DRAFT_406798 [Aulographum hederae CBS 113979]|uniref:Uncharacterized protein n=1 Tax=Aulographum hederae CBS 113979 TaxID=1176131 RepID=A0A6G1GS31_9PEZI|nr:hypothetical protein K402DRAFT_406798 [Aulographum hederae CBS 113979]